MAERRENGGIFLSVLFAPQGCSRRNPLVKNLDWRYWARYGRSRIGQYSFFVRPSLTSGSGFHQDMQRLEKGSL